MSPEMLSIYRSGKKGEYNAEKTDIFSLGLTFIAVANLLEEE